MIFILVYEWTEPSQSQCAQCMDTLFYNIKLIDWELYLKQNREAQSVTLLVSMGGGGGGMGGGSVPNYKLYKVLLINRIYN